MPKITLGGWEFDQTDFHRILKPKILSYLEQKGYDVRKIGSNPDIKVKQGKVILEGQQKGGQIKTNIKFTDILEHYGYL